MLDLKLGREPVLILSLILTAINAVQIAAISMPTWAHTVIVIVSTIIAAILQRSQVSPVLKPVAPVEGRPPMT
jgi:hypothetical protein